jgi:hypothetical protein
MARVYLTLNNNKWEIVDNSNFWLDKPMLNMLNSVRSIQKKGWDGVILIDGMERSGKSTLAMICGWYLSNGTLSENNFASGLTDCAKKIQDLPDGSVLIVDEGSIVFSSRDAMNKEQRKLMQILDVVGQKNLVFIICLPCLFDLNKTIALRRSKFLLHVYPDSEYNRGNYAFWGEKLKKKLYSYGKKNFDSYEYPPAEFIGKYFQFKPPFWDIYTEKIKKESLREVLKNATEGLDAEARAKSKLLKVLKNLKQKYPDLTLRELGRIFEVEHSTIQYWLFEIEKKEKEQLSE